MAVEDCADDLKDYARRIIIRHECQTLPITMITPKDAKQGIQPSEVPLKMCVNADEIDASVCVQGILDHLVAANRRILQLCGSFDDEDSELYGTAADSIELTHLNRRSDVVDISECELLSMLQECTQQSLVENSRSFEMNLAALESR